MSIELPLPVGDPGMNANYAHGRVRSRREVDNGRTPAPVAPLRDSIEIVDLTSDSDEPKAPALRREVACVGFASETELREPSPSDSLGNTDSADIRFSCARCYDAIQEAAVLRICGCVS